MSGFLSSLPGFVEGGEAGIGVESISAEDETSASPNHALISGRHSKRLLGAATLAAGVVIGNKFGENAAGIVDNTIGDGGVGYLPAIAVGSLTSWHALRGNDHRPDKELKRMNKWFERVPAALVGGFSLWEGMESGFVTSTGDAKLGTALLATGAGYAAGMAIIHSLEAGARKISPRNFFKWGRTIALLGPVAIAGKATPELLEEPKMAGAAVAAAGAVAVGTALTSNFFPEKVKGLFGRQKVATR